MLEQFRRHATRLKWNPVIAITLVQPPILIEQPAFILQPLVKWRAGKRREVIERRDVERMFPRKRDGLGKTFGRVAVIAEDKSAIDTDVMLAQIRQRFGEAAAHRVERLVHVLQVGRVQTLEPDQHALAAAAHQQFQKFFVVRRIDAGLAHPADFQGYQRAEKLLRLFNVRRDVVVHEEEKFSFALHLFYFRDYFVNRAAGLRGIENRLHGAKVALEMAATSGLHQADGQIALAAKDGAVGFQAGERRAAGLAVKHFESAVARALPLRRTRRLRRNAPLRPDKASRENRP